MSSSFQQRHQALFVSLCRFIVLTRKLNLLFTANESDLFCVPSHHASYARMHSTHFFCACATRRKPLLTRIKFVKRKATKTCKKEPDNLEELCTKFVPGMPGNVQLHKIPPELVLNVDETGLPVVPVSQWTMAEQGVKQVPMTGFDDKRQITALLTCSLSGDFLPPKRCHLNFKLPPSWDIWHSQTHWSNSNMFTRYISNVASVS